VARLVILALALARLLATSDAEPRTLIDMSALPEALALPLSLALPLLLAEPETLALPLSETLSLPLPLPLPLPLGLAVADALPPAASVDVALEKADPEAAAFRVGRAVRRVEADARAERELVGTSTVGVGEMREDREAMAELLPRKPLALPPALRLGEAVPLAVAAPPSPGALNVALRVCEAVCAAVTDARQAVPEAIGDTDGSLVPLGDALGGALVVAIADGERDTAGERDRAAETLAEGLTEDAVVALAGAEAVRGELGDALADMPLLAEPPPRRCPPEPGEFVGVSVLDRVELREERGEPLRVRSAVDAGETLAESESLGVVEALLDARAVRESSIVALISAVERGEKEGVGRVDLSAELEREPPPPVVADTTDDALTEDVTDRVCWNRLILA
jgi:hypothetical protein